MCARRVGVLLGPLLVALCCATPLAAQTRHYLYYFQGDQHIASGFVLPTDNGYRIPTAGTQQLPLATGDEVCVRFVNGHPVKYGYSLGVTVDTTAYVLPDLAAQVALLQPLLKGLQEHPVAASPLLAARTGPAAAGQPGAGRELNSHKQPEPPRPAKAFAWYVDTLTRLASDVEDAREVALRSDASEPPGVAGSAPQSLRTGFRWARWMITDQLPGGDGRFRDEQLQAHLATWAAQAMAAAGSDSTQQTLAISLATYGALLLSARDQLRAVYTTGPEMPETCAKVGAGPTTFRVTIARRDSIAFARRFAGVDSASVILVRPPYVRQVVGLHPIGFGTVAGNVPHFSVDGGGVLRGPRDDATAYRAGALINVNLTSFGPEQRVGAGVGLGIGTAGKDNVLSDFFLAGVVSVADAIWLGIGYGVSDFPVSVKGGTVDQPLDLKGQKLDDLIETSARRALYIVFALPGLKLK